MVVSWPHGALLVTRTSQLMQELDEVHVHVHVHVHMHGLPFDVLSIKCICELVTCAVSL